MRCSALGADFPAERFIRTPISVIRRILRELDDRERAEANLTALPTARLTQIVLQVAHGLSGSKKAEPKTRVQEFLPYPDWRPSVQDADGPDDPTKFILTELGRKCLVPLHVFAALITPVEQRP